MDDRFQLSIAGVTIDFASDSPRLPEGAVEKFYAPFSSDQDAELRVTVRCGGLPKVSPEEELFDATSPHRWRLGRTDGHYVFEVFDNMPPHETIQVASVDSSWNRAEVHIRPAGFLSGRPAWSLVRLMQPLGELLVIQRLSQGQGMLLHGLGVIDGGDGLVFVGPSGAGKSTLANLYDEAAAGATVLNDEHVAVVKRAASFWLFGTPWPGSCLRARGGRAPIRGVYLLEHDVTNRLVSEHPATLCALLAQQMFLPFWSQEALAHALRLADELVEAVPTYRLGFVNDATAIEFLRKEA